MRDRIPVILCVGSDKIMGDSVGPTVGNLLAEKYNVKFFVYGVSGRSVNGKNLTEYVDFVKTVHDGSPIIAVDACVSNREPLGSVKIQGGGINPKRALTKLINPVGDVGILGVVGDVSDNPLCALLSASGVNTINLCGKIALALYAALSAGSVIL